jgi:prevent-host-death family protein
MRDVKMDDAGQELAELVEAAIHGEEVVITRGGRQVARLVSVPLHDRRPRFGSAAGKVQLTDSFDYSLPDLSEYTP